MKIGTLIIHLYLPRVLSLKNKRSVLKPILSRIHRTFNVSAAEIGMNDHWNQAVLAVVYVSNDHSHIQEVLQKVVNIFPEIFPNVEIVNHRIEFI